MNCSRAFVHAKEQKEIAKRVEAGDVDVVIGTHRLLSKDVQFKELGIVVVDEEQRFGVAHKERLKQLKKRVDVLTLSATPIPRTLNMSLSGLRDMSLIETPPRDRLAIQTQVVQFSENVIKSAIELELGRGGQVFLHPQSGGNDRNDCRAGAAAGAPGAHGGWPRPDERKGNGARNARFH